VGLVVITPAAGYVRPGWALIMEMVRSACAYGFHRLKRKSTKLEDPLDVFTCHGIGGLAGSLMTGLFAEDFINPSTGHSGAFYGNGIQFWYQIAAILVVIPYSMVLTTIICVVLKYTIGLEVTKLEAALGMDRKDHLKQKLNHLKPSDSQTPEEAEMVAAYQKARNGDKGEALSPAEENGLKRVFDVFDEEHRGKLGSDEFENAVLELGVRHNKEEAKALFSALDRGESGAIDFVAFRNYFVQTGSARKLSTQIERTAANINEEAPKPEAKIADAV